MGLTVIHFNKLHSYESNFITNTVYEWWFKSKQDLLITNAYVNMNKTFRAVVQ